MVSEALIVCVVDDDESVRESLPDLLHEFGLVSKAFGSGEEFLASGLVDQAECLILDVAMPGMSGPQLRRHLVEHGYAIPTIFITGQQDAASRPEVREGAVTCLVKPFSDAVLLQALKKALSPKSDWATTLA